MWLAPRPDGLLTHFASPLDEKCWLKPGSVLVSEGDEVLEGEAIGACGNSGNTSEPHIHIHHQRRDPKARPLHFPEGLPLYFLDHNGEAMPNGGFEIRDGETVLTGAIVRHVGAEPVLSSQ